MKALAWLAVAGLLLHGNWEWLQSPLYKDSTASLDRIVWFRLHCTLGDVLILVIGALAVSLLVRSLDWLHRPRWGPIALLTAGAILYTVASERRNLAAGLELLRADAGRPLARRGSRSARAVAASVPALGMPGGKAFARGPEIE